MTIKCGQRAHRSQASARCTHRRVQRAVPSGALWLRTPAAAPGRPAAQRPCLFGLQQNSTELRNLQTITDACRSTESFSCKAVLNENLLSKGVTMLTFGELCQLECNSRKRLPQYRCRLNLHLFRIC